MTDLSAVSFPSHLSELTHNSSPSRACASTEGRDGHDFSPRSTRNRGLPHGSTRDGSCPLLIGGSVQGIPGIVMATALATEPTKVDSSLATHRDLGEDLLRQADRM